MLLYNPNAKAWAEKFRNSQQDSTCGRDAEDAIRFRTELLLETDPDDLLSLLASPQWAFDDGHLRQVNDVLDAFINARARQQLKEVANRCLDSQDDPFTVLQDWLNEEKSETLGQMINAITVPDRLITFCYAWLEVYEIARAIYTLERHRRMPALDFENWEHTAEEHESDRRFAKLA